MKHLLAAALCLSIVACAPAGAQQAGMNATHAAEAADREAALSLLADPPRDEAHPAHNKQLLVPSHGVGMNALFFLAAGEGPKPTMVLLHGLPGNERNLDLAQAVRRAGWNVLTFTYRGAWGSPGKFSIAGAIEDASAAIAFLRSPEAIRAYNIDIDRLVIAGHSMGGLAAALHAAREGPGDPPLAGVILLDAWNAGAEGAATRAGGPAARAQFEAGIDDLGNSVQGATPASLAGEVIAHAEEWDLLHAAPALARRRLLIIYAKYGIAEQNRALVTAVQRACPMRGKSVDCGGRISVKELASDHSFADHRISLAAEVVGWLREFGTRLR